MEKVNIDEKFVNFYWDCKQLRTTSIKYGFGAGSLPAGYTEELCREVYTLSPFNKDNHPGKNLNAKDFDAEKDKELIEIKFNNLITNAVNVNLKKEFDYLYHTFIDFDKDIYTVRIFKGNDVRSQFGNSGNISTPIKSFSKNLNPTIDNYKFKEDGLYKVD